MDRDGLIQSIVRALDALELVGSSARGVPLCNLCGALRLKRQTLYNILHTLTKKGFLEKVGRKYRLGPALARLHRVQSEYVMLQRAVRCMMNLSRKTAAEVVLAEHVGGEIIAVLLIPAGPGEIPTNPLPWPLHPYGTGLVFQAYWSEAQLREYRKRHPFSEATTDVAYWKSEDRVDRFLPVIRRRGCLVLRSDPFRLAAPIFDSAGGIRAFISITKPMNLVSPAEERTYRELVCQAAREITFPPPQE